jgi:hypothetical protein
MSRRGPNPETPIQAAIMLAVGNRPDVRIWRNNRGKARRRLANGELGRPVEFGLGPGSADLVGIIAGGRFLGIEAKTTEAYATKNHGLSDDQLRWKDTVERFGGLYIVAESAERAVSELDAALSEPEAFRG